MRIRDLGRLEGPVWLFGGACSNLQATLALLARARGAGVEGARIVSTGDAVGYGADPEPVLAALKRAGVAAIAGNVERQLARGADECGCGFGPGSTCAALSRGWYAHADARLGRAWRDWMAALPDWLVFDCAAGRFAVVHGGAEDISRFLWPSAPEAELAAEIARLEARLGRLDGVIAGHCGLAFERRVGPHRWINAGALGLPPHDGRPATRFAVLEARGLRLCRLDYDFRAAARAMQAAGLGPEYARTLVTGIWPDEAILPGELRRALGGIFI